MIAATRSKFVCFEVDEFGPSERVKLTAVYEPADGDNEENKRFYAASPSGNLVLTVDNPEVHGFFEKGAYYYLVITKAPRDGDG